jgi:hypothetical protein
MTTNKGENMALLKIQDLIQKVSESQKVKKVVTDLQSLSTDIQKKVQTLNADEAVKKYKEIFKKVSKAEGDLQKEVNRVIVKIKKSAVDIEKNLELYKKKAAQQRAKIEKLLKTKQAKSTTKARPKTAAKKAARKPAARRTAKAKKA